MNRQTHIHIFAIVLVLLLLAVTPLAAQDNGPPRTGLRPDAPEYALHGPYWVGTTELTIEPESERPLPLTVWYPALNPAGTPEITQYVYADFPTIEGFSIIGKALKDAEPSRSDTPYPMVVLVHGAGGYRYDLAYLAEHLASQGFVVTAVDHVGSTVGYVLDPELTRPDFSGFFESFTRPLVTYATDIRRQIDFATAANVENGFLAGLIDLNQIGVVGHSMGGFGALAAAGGRVSMVPDRIWCEENADIPEVTSSWVYVLRCFFMLPSEAAMLNTLGFDVEPGDLWPAYDVVGVDAIVPISPVPAVTSDSLEQITTPALFIMGDHDMTVVPADMIDRYSAIRSDRKGLVVLQNADHVFPHQKCTDPWFFEHQAAVICAWESVWDMDRAHDLINHFTTAFLLAELKGDDAARAALAPDAVAFPGITYEAVGF